MKFSEKCAMQTILEPLLESHIASPCDLVEGKDGVQRPNVHYLVYSGRNGGLFSIRCGLKANIAREDYAVVKLQLDCVTVGASIKEWEELPKLMLNAPQGLADQVKAREAMKEAKKKMALAMLGRAFSMR
jgi:hypothetical protein